MILEFAENFKNGIAKVKLIREGYTYIDKKGMPIFNGKYNYLTEFVDGITIATISDGNHIYMDINEKQVVPGRYQGTTKAFSEGLTPVSQAKNHVFYCYIDLNGNEVFSRRFKIAGSFHCGIARVGEWEYKYNEYINKEGNTVKLMLRDDLCIEDQNELILKSEKLREEKYNDIKIDGYYTYFILGNITVVVFDEDYNKYLEKVAEVEEIINQQLKEDNIQNAAEIYSTLKLAK